MEEVAAGVAVTAGVGVATAAAEVAVDTDLVRRKKRAPAFAPGLSHSQILQSLPQFLILKVIRR
jgi:hypothetical protein